MKVLFVDDMMSRHMPFLNKYAKSFEQIVPVTTYDAALKELVMGKYDMVFLDHDLSTDASLTETEEKTGADLAKHVVNTFEVKGSPYFVVHSLNPVGRASIVNILSDAGFTVMGLPFDLLCSSDTTIDWY